jgi:hypothetical protein
MIHHSFDAPAAFQGSEGRRLAPFRRVRDELRDYLRGSSPGVIASSPRSRSIPRGMPDQLDQFSIAFLIKRRTPRRRLLPH